MSQLRAKEVGFPRHPCMADPSLYVATAESRWTEQGAMARDAELSEFAAARGAALTRAAYLLTGDQSAADDLVQETYVVMVRRWRRIDKVDPEPYVRRIMYSRFIDGYRHRRRNLLELPTWRPPEPAPTGNEADATADRVCLADALSRLTASQRAVVVLRFFEDLTEVQTAETLGVSPNTVKSQARAALARLRELVPEIVDPPTAPPEEDAG